MFPSGSLAVLTIRDERFDCGVGPHVCLRLYEKSPLLYIIVYMIDHQAVGYYLLASRFLGLQNYLQGSNSTFPHFALSNRS